ncbi:MAG: ATP-binding protein [Pseudobutyrivibrio sp.]|nr:ATP-binding protein [Pseudobutyrivibrio sp.]
MQNPFTHAFGARPNKYISTLLEESIIENFRYSSPSERCYMLTGVRGSGKTVMMSSVAKTLAGEDEWFICNLILTEDIINQFAAKLAENKHCAKLFIKTTGINLSVAALSAGIEYDKETVFDLSTLIARMIESISKQGQKVLITIDDIFMSDGMVRFAQLFQYLLTDSRELPVYLIMTGLYQNYREITDVGNQKLRGCTFLTRTLEREVPPLDESQMVVSYFNTFGIDEKEAIKLAKMTKGYAFAYQVLGYWYFEKYINKNESVRDVEVEYRSELIKYSYGKLWTELSDKDRVIIKALVKLDADKNVVKRKDVIEYMNENNEPITSSVFNKYRERLLGKGIIGASDNRDGNLWLPLPEFGNFIRLYHMEEY